MFCTIFVYQKSIEYRQDPKQSTQGTVTMEENRKILPTPKSGFKLKPYTNPNPLEQQSGILADQKDLKLNEKPSIAVNRSKHHIGLYPIDDGRGRS